MEREIITTPKSSGTGSTTELSSCGKAECDSTRYSKFMFSTQDPAPGRNKSKATVVPGEVNVSQILLSKTTLSIEDNPFRVLKYSEPYAFNYGTFMGLRGTTYKRHTFILKIISPAPVLRRIFIWRRQEQVVLCLHTLVLLIWCL